MKAEHPAAPHGSQRWLQIAVNRCFHRLDKAIKETGLCQGEEIEWLSPLEGDGFAEYRDDEFLERLGVCLDKRQLRDFWPRSGPRWDGLARTSGGSLLLLEAKANIPEFDTDPTGATGIPLERIKASLVETREFLKVKSGTDWAQCFYQYTNRLAHLYLLRELNGLPAHLVFVYFVGDTTVCGRAPVSREGWEAAIALATKHLGIPNTRWVSESVRDVFIDVSDMDHVAWPGTDRNSAE